MLTKSQAQDEADRIEKLRQKADALREKAGDLEDQACEARKALEKVCPHPAEMIEGGMFMNECRLCGANDY